MNDIFRDMIEVKNLFYRIFNKDIKINILLIKICYIKKINYFLIKQINNLKKL